ncbi:MAG: hypothetical protein ABJB32_00095 [Verrucomicrobiota bacterium]
MVKLPQHPAKFFVPITVRLAEKLCAFFLCNSRELVSSQSATIYFNELALAFLEMRRLALEKFAAAEFADKSSFARRDLPPNANDVRLSLDFHPFE